MSESYSSKRERWQKLLDGLPESLRGHISLRNVEAVAGLSPKAQMTLAEAIQSGLKRLPRAIDILRASPTISVAELLEKVSAASPAPSMAAVSIEPIARKRLADLIQICYPDMPRLSAEALSQAEPLEAVLHVLSALESLFRSPHLNADFVVVIFQACLSHSMVRLEAHLASNPAFQQALAQSGLNSNLMEVTNA